MTIYILYMLFKRLRKKIRNRIALRKLVAEKANKWSQQATCNYIITLTDDKGYRTTGKFVKE